MVDDDDIVMRRRGMEPLDQGAVGHATNIVEHSELIALGIANFVSVVGRENVIAGSDWGVSQG